MAFIGLASFCGVGGLPLLFGRLVIFRGRTPVASRIHGVHLVVRCSLVLALGDTLM